MSNKVHIAVRGDTFESLSTRYFGEPSQAGRIKSANPGVSSPIIVASTKVIIPGAIEAATQGNEPDGLTIRIGGTTFRHVTESAITRSLDAVDTVEFRAPLADTPEFRELIQPFSFPTLDVSEDGVRLFRGTLVNVAPSVGGNGSSVRLSGYSLPGVLGDCTMPASAFPLQFRNVNIVDIASKLLEPFGLSVKREGDVGGPFRRVKMKRDRRVMAFLTNLAKQRQLLLRSNADGELVIAEPPAVSNPVASLRQGESPLKSVTPEFRSQSYYSHVTGIRSTRRGLNGTQHTVPNARAVEAGIIRPLILSMRDTSRGELPRAAQAAAGRMLAGSIVYSATVATWRDPTGAVWTPGDTVELTAPSVFVPEPFKFQIRAARLIRTVEGTTAELSLILPGAFGGEPPSVLPWQ